MSILTRTVKEHVRLMMPPEGHVSNGMDEMEGNGEDAGEAEKEGVSVLNVGYGLGIVS